MALWQRTQSRFRKGRISDGLGIERITAIDEREKITIAMCCLQKRVDERGASSADMGTGDFGDGVFRQTAFGRMIEDGNIRL